MTSPNISSVVVVIVVVVVVLGPHLQPDDAFQIRLLWLERGFRHQSPVYPRHVLRTVWRRSSFQIFYSLGGSGTPLNALHDYGSPRSATAWGRCGREGRIDGDAETNFQMGVCQQTREQLSTDIFKAAYG